jgi:hypothetical protein
MTVKPAPPAAHAYRIAHDRVRTMRGRAAAHPCAHCGGVARDWAYDHGDLAAVVDSKGRVFSRDAMRYLPLCVPCHRRLDEPLTTALARATAISIPCSHCNQPAGSFCRSPAGQVYKNIAWQHVERRRLMHTRHRGHAPTEGGTA